MANKTISETITDPNEAMPQRVVLYGRDPNGVVRTSSVGDRGEQHSFLLGAKNTNNSTQDALGSGAEFTGDWVVNDFQQWAVNVAASHVGTLYIEAGIVVDGATITNGVVADADVNRTLSVPRTIYASTTEASPEKPYFRPLINIPGRAFRVRYVNGGTAQDWFYLHTAYGSNLFPASATTDNELIVTTKEQETNVFTAYGKTVTSDGTTWAVLIDLSDTTNWKHTETGRIDFATLSLNIDKSSNAQGSVSIGVITRIDGTNADVTLFFGKSFSNSTSTEIEIFRNFWPSTIKCGVASSEAKYLQTTAKLTSQTALNTATPLDSAEGAGTVTPAVGDIVIRFVKTGGTTYTAALQGLYHAEADV